MAVGDAIKDASGINNFRVFMDKLFSLYHASPKNKYELKACAAELEQQVYAIGRVLDTRWVSSSVRTVEAVLNNLPSLVAHFIQAKDDRSRKSQDRSMYKGLLSHLTTPAFVGNLCLMADALQPLSELSKALQHRDVNVVTAHKMIQSRVALFQQRKNSPGEWYQKYMAVEASDSGEFLCGKDSAIPLEGTASVQRILPGQFYQSLSDAMRSRLMTTQSRRGDNPKDADAYAKSYEDLLNSIQTIDSATWPVILPPNFGRDAMSFLANCFFISEKQKLLEWEIYKASMGSTISTSGQLNKLFIANKTLIVSTAECERAFSVMNDILTPTRNSLGINRLAMLILVKLLGPDVKNFKPTPFVGQWLRAGRRSAETTMSRKREANREDKCYYEPLHKLFKA